MRYIILFFLFSGLQTTVFSQDYIQHYRDGIEAYEGKDFHKYLYHFQQSDSLRPNHRVLLYHLARAYALTNQLKSTFDVLSYRTGFYAVDDFSEDKDFSLLTESGQMDELQEKINNSNQSQKNSKTVFEVDIEGFHAEGITYNRSNNRFYLTDIRNGWIYSVGRDGSKPQKELDLKDFGYWSAMGIEFDPMNNDQLWVTTSAMQNFEGYSDSLLGRSAVLNINLSTGKVISAYKVEGNHVFGDLIFRKDGSIIISDSGDSSLFIIDSDRKEMNKLISDSLWWNLQGITFSEDEQFLYVSDYITGIYIVDLTTKKVTPLTIRNELLRGSDGIYLLGNKLMMLQNGTSPKRVASIELSGDGKGVAESIAFPDNALDELDEPTLGVLVGSELYYIANSPWAYYTEEGEPIIESWKPIRINKLSIK